MLSLVPPRKYSRGHETIFCDINSYHIVAIRFCGSPDNTSRMQDYRNRDERRKR